MNRRRHRLSFAAALALMVALAAGPAPAQLAESGAQSLLIDPSIRASGMGRASAALFWGGDANYWANPALLGYRDGLTYEWGSTRLVPDLAEGVYFKTKRMTLGYGGLGIAIAGKPVDGFGSQRLDYGVSVATDINGDPIGTFSSYEDIRSFGIGGSVLELAQTAARELGDRSLGSLARYGDVSVGWSTKRTVVDLLPAGFTPGASGRGEATTYDSGWLARLTPYNSIDHPGLLGGFDRMIAVRLDGSYGRSTQNYNDALISYVSVDQSDPIERDSRRGWAWRIAVDLPRSLRQEARGQGMGWFLDLTSPLIQWSQAWDRLLPTVRDPVTRIRYEGTRVYDKGWELVFLHIAYLRGGHIDDPVGTVQGTTSGWGFGLDWGGAAGFGYDRAIVPQSIYLGQVRREGFVAYVNPIRLREKLHPGGG